MRKPKLAGSRASTFGHGILPSPSVKSTESSDKSTSGTRRTPAYLPDRRGRCPKFKPSIALTREMPPVGSSFDHRSYTVCQPLVSLLAGSEPRESTQLQLASHYFCLSSCQTRRRSTRTSGLVQLPLLTSIVNVVTHGICQLNRSTVFLLCSAPNYTTIL